MMLNKSSVCKSMFVNICEEECILFFAKKSIEDDLSRKNRYVSYLIICLFVEEAYL